MSHSLNEISALAKKATRGAGYDWGMAEEAGTATAWLAAHGIDGTAALAGLLEKVRGKDKRTLTPETIHGAWRGSAGALCPLIAGAALSDAALIWANHGQSFEMVLFPVLLLPFSFNAAQALGREVTTGWSGVVAVTNGDAFSLTVADADQLFVSSVPVTIACGGIVDVPLPRGSRARPTAMDLATLDRFAHLTHAPETEESRRNGAGAGLTDNN